MYSYRQPYPIPFMVEFQLNFGSIESVLGHTDVILDLLALTCHTSEFFHTFTQEIEMSLSN